MAFTTGTGADAIVEVEDTMLYLLDHLGQPLGVQQRYQCLDYASLLLVTVADSVIIARLVWTSYQTHLAVLYGRE